MYVYPKHHTVKDIPPLVAFSSILSNFSLLLALESKPEQH